MQFLSDELQGCTGSVKFSLEMHNLFNCFKVIISTVYPAHLFINTLRNLTLYLEDRNISDKVQKLNSDCSLMELIYFFFFFFAFVYVIQENLNPIHMFCACIPEATHSLFVGALNFSVRVRGNDDADPPLMKEHLLSSF